MMVTLLFVIFLIQTQWIIVLWMLNIISSINSDILENRLVTFSKNVSKQKKYSTISVHTLIVNCIENTVCVFVCIVEKMTMCLIYTLQRCTDNLQFMHLFRHKTIKISNILV